jgi:imidazolonepropionase-like amidohydrolase
LKYKLTLSLLILVQSLNLFCQSIPVQDFPDISDSFFREYLKVKSRFYVIQNVNIIPMNKDTILRNQTIIVKDGKIIKIDESKRIQISNKAEIIDGNGKYLIPGLIDMHVHFFNQNDLILFVANGVTIVRNMMGNQSHLKIRDKIRKNTIFGPNIFTTGPYITQLYDINQAKTIVPECKSNGYDYLKIGGFLSDECYREIMRQSRIYGIKAVGHLPFSGGLKAAIEEKQYTIEHIMQLITKNGFTSDSIDTRENIYDKLNMVAQSGTWLCITHPQVVYNNSIKNEEDRKRISQYKYIHPAEFMKWYSDAIKEFTNTDLVKESTKKFFDMKGKIILGTDCSMPFIIPGFSVHEQLKMFVSAGLTPYQALKTGTYNAAECLEILDKSGTIEVGKNADLVLLNGNPLENINNTSNIEGIILKGVWFPQNELQEMMVYLSNYYRNEIIPLYTQRAVLPDEVRNIYNDNEESGKSNIKYILLFGFIIFVLLTSGIYINRKIKLKNKLKTLA